MCSLQFLNCSSNLPICTCSLKFSDGRCPSLQVIFLERPKNLPKSGIPTRKNEENRIMIDSSAHENPSTWWKNQLNFQNMCYVATFQQSVGEKRRQLNPSSGDSTVLSEKMLGQADDPWVFAPQSSGIGQRNFIQSLGSIGPTGGFKRIWCLGIFCWRKNGAGLFLGLGSLSKSRVGGFTVIFLLKSITVVFQKHVEIVENPQDDFC